MAIIAQCGLRRFRRAQAQMNALRHHPDSRSFQIEGRKPTIRQRIVERVTLNLLASDPIVPLVMRVLYHDYAARSNMAAMPWPPPIHIVSKP